MSALKWAESALLQLPLRIGLGGVFVYAGYNKFDNVQAFAFAIKGFKILDPDKHGHLIISAAYTMPWVEMIAGILLILGWRTKAVSLTIGLMLIAFMAALLHVIYSPEIEADCSCFGDVNLVCEATVGWCQVIRDIVLLIPVGYLMWRGGGNLAIDALVDPTQNTKNAVGDAKSTPIGADAVDESGIRA